MGVYGNNHDKREAHEWSLRCKKSCHKGCKYRHESSKSIEGWMELKKKCPKNVR